jgi:hypothetical protein
MRHPDYHPAEAPPKQIATSEGSNFVNPISLVCISDTPTTPPPPHFPQGTSSYALATFRSMALSPRSGPANLAHVTATPAQARRCRQSRPFPRHSLRHCASGPRAGRTSRQAPREEGGGRRGAWSGEIAAVRELGVLV